MKRFRSLSLLLALTLLPLAGCGALYEITVTGAKAA